MRSAYWKSGISLVLIAGLVWFGVTAFQSSLTPYRSFTDARASGGYVQVNGTLPDPQDSRSTAGVLHFRLEDEEGEILDVAYEGVKPANFEQATSVVAIGQYKEGVFKADQLLVKCPSKYQAEGSDEYLDAREAPAAATEDTPVPGGT